MKCFVLNGWAASERAWDLCRFRRDRIFSYIEQLDGLAEKALASCDGAVRVGWSMGGSTALRLALGYPEKVKALVLVAATPRMMEDRDGGWAGMSPRRLEALRRGVEITHGEGFFGVAEGKPNADLIAAGFVSSKHLVKILGNGEITTKLEVEAHAFSQSAIAAIEAKGGSAVKL